MAFAAAQLSPLVEAQGFTMWLYRSLDASTVVDSSGYFNDASAFMSVGDLIIQQDVTGIDAPTAVNSGGHMWVLSNASGVVDCSNITAVVVTDGD
jgi:hypothetical protein